MDLDYQDLDWKRLIVKHYKAYGLDEKSLAVVFVLDDILASLKGPVTANDLVSYMTLSKEEIDKILVLLLEKKYIAYLTKEEKLVTTLKPLKEKILADLKKDIVIEANEAGKEPDKGVVNTLYTYFEEQLGRPLTGREVDRISLWLKTGATEGMIKEAVYKLQAQNKAVSLAGVDKILLAIQKSGDINKEGYTTRKENWRQGDQETIDILSKPWVPNGK
ncbi:MAG: DnaD domain protein [Bacilli bacterium]|jgi:DNA replication protein DnaD|nr:DnaD domain protein [Bacilli bacterium]